MSKFRTKSPFGVQTKRFSTIGYHPGLDPDGTMRPNRTKVSPGDYDPEHFECPYKKYNKAGSPWKRKAESEEYAQNLGFRNHTILDERRYLRSLGGPGSYDVSEEIYKRKCFSVLKDINFGNEVKFFQLSDANPGPGTYSGDIIKTGCVNKKFMIKRPPFEWDGFRDRFKTATKPWSKPPNLYNPIDIGSIEGLLNKVVSKNGPYNVFTGPRDGTTIKNHFAPPKLCTPDKYYTWPNGLDYLLHHSSKKRCGAFLKDLRFTRKPTVRMLMNDLTTCYRDPTEPSPATYDIKIDSITKLEPTLYPFNDSVQIARKGVRWTIQPGPGRYNATFSKCKKVKSQSWAIEYLDIKCGPTICQLKLTGKGISPEINFKPDFLVYRVAAKSCSNIEFSIEINNSCEAAINLVFENILELEGLMKVMEKPTVHHAEKTAKAGKKDKGKKKEKRAKSSKSSKSSKSQKKKKGKDKPMEFSNELTEDEVYSISNFYDKRRGASYFKVVDENMVEIKGLSKKSVKLRFGVQEEHQIGSGKEKKKDKKGGTDKKEKKDKMGKKEKKSKGTSKSSKGGSKKCADDKYYVAKYNVLLGGRTFVKDIIVIGHFY